MRSFVILLLNQIIFFGYYLETMTTSVEKVERGGKRQREQEISIQLIFVWGLITATGLEDVQERVISSCFSPRLFHFRHKNQSNQLQDVHVGDELQFLKLNYPQMQLAVTRKQSESHSVQMQVYI